MNKTMQKLNEIQTKPKLYSKMTTSELWSHPHVSKFMLEAHLNPNTDSASRNHKFIDDSFTFIKNRFNLKKGIDIIDFGCGPGLYTTKFAKTGANVTGIDFSSNSIQYAKETALKENLSISYLNQNYLSYKAKEQFDLITMIYCDFSALNDNERLSLLKTFKTHLKQDGHIFMDVHTSNLYNDFEEGYNFNIYPEGGFWRSTKYFEFVNRFKYTDVTLEKYSIVTEENEFEIYNWLKCFSLNSLKQEFQNVGLEITEVYNDVSGTPYNDKNHTMAIVAKHKKREA